MTDCVETAGVEPNVRQLLRFLEPARTATYCASLLERFLDDDTLYALPVIDDDGRPVALVDRKQYIEFFSRTYTREIFGRRRIVALLAHSDYENDPPIVVNEDCPVSEVSRIILERGVKFIVKGFLVSREGRYVGVASGHDLLSVITERKQDELARFNAELEMRVALRTSELEAANSQLASFSYTIAHDLRAPVRAINGFSEMVLQLTQGVLEDRAAGYLRRVTASSQRLGEMIDDLLDLARFSRQEMKMRTIDISAIASSVIASLSDAHPERRVVVTLQPDMKATGDPGLIRVLLNNLVGNAWKFTSKTDTARISIGAVRRDGKATTYFVRDNGAGFDMRYSHKLFEPFQRLHHASEFEGTGIGLATVKKIVQRHGGIIALDSAPERGTTVSFTLGRAG